jgi:hypothetical protein
LRPAQHECVGAMPTMQIVRSLDEAFRRLHERSVAFVAAVPPDKLYAPARNACGSTVPAARSCGEHLLRSAACIEQTCGGLLANLWDDPFEWTLPETLATHALVAEYLSEVEATRQRCFALWADDAALAKEIALPTGTMQTLFALLLATLVRAAHHQGRALATFEMMKAE